MDEIIELSPSDSNHLSYIDWPGYWYELGREQGHNDVFEFVSIDLKTGAKTSYLCSHQKSDGVGAFSFLQEKLLGNTFDFKVSKSKSIKKLTNIQKFLVTQKVLRESFSKKEIDWLSFDQSKSLVKKIQPVKQRALITRP